MDAQEVWEGEGRASQPATAAAREEMTATVDQIDLAAPIKTKINQEFDRLARVLKRAARKRAEQDRADIRLMIAILEQKRTEVMRSDRACHFIHSGQELRGQVREMIAKDPRYKSIQASRARML